MLVNVKIKLIQILNFNVKKMHGILGSLLNWRRNTEYSSDFPNNLRSVASSLCSSG